MRDILNLIGTLGFGGIITILIKAYIDKRETLSKRSFETRLEAYVNYLDIAMRSQTMDDNKAGWERTAASDRVRLCGSKNVIRLMEIAANKSPDIQKAYDELRQAMRQDLFPHEKKC